jgi:TonB family protein
LLRIVVGLAYLAHCRQKAAPIAPLPERVQALQRRFGLDIPFLSTDRLSVPVTFGWARPIVMVPSFFGRLTADEQEGVACHELLHIQRRDWPVTLAEEIVRAILWFHPAVWILLSRTALCREQVVDTGTVAMTGKRRQYLDALWQIVCSSHGPPMAGAVPLIGRSHLRARVEHLKKETVMSRTRIIITGACLATTVVVGGMVGATVFASTSAGTSDSLSLANPWSTGEDKPVATEKEKSGEYKKLETWEHDAPCAEITHPEVKDKVNPKYPPEAREQKIMGSVVLRSIIDEAGVVRDLEIVESPDELLSEAATQAVKQWTFEPALCDGEPVGVYYNLTVRFQLK